MLDIIILSDNKNTTKGLEKICENYSYEKLIPLNVVSTKDLKSILKSGPSNAILFIVDNFEERSAIKTAQILRESQHDEPIVIITGNHSLVYDGFKVGAYRVLKAPIANSDVYEAIDSHIKHKLSYKIVLLKDGMKKITIPVNDILYVLAEDRETAVVTKTGRIETKTPLFQILAQLPEDLFFPCHRSYVVNLFNIRIVTSGTTSAIMLDGSTIPISRRKKEAFLAARERFIQNHTIPI